MVSTTSGPSTRPPRPSATQITASALAAVSAAVISSTFGVAGTLIGAAVASVVASVGSTLYMASMRRTNEQLRRIAAAAAVAGSARRGRPALPSDPTLENQPVDASAAPAPFWNRLRTGLPTLRKRWLAVIGLAMAAFALAIGSLTIVEASANKPVSALLGGGNGSGTSVGSVFDPKTHSSPTPTPTPSPTPASTTTPSPSATPSSSPSPSGSPTPSPSESDAGSAASPSPSPSATASEGATPAPATTPATVP